jgi:F-type H+-transporting ATPase subunit gamma
LTLTANRGLCGGYNSGVLRLAQERWIELNKIAPNCSLEVSGKRGLTAFKFRKIKPDESFTHFDDSPKFAEVELIAERYLQDYLTGKLDRLDVAYTRFINVARQEPVIETLLPLGGLEGAEEAEGSPATGETQYEFLPSAKSILEEVVPMSFKVKLFKCFLDSAVSEQVARMVAMKAATENADEIIRDLSMTYNRARQGRITGELLEVIGGVEALNK